MPKWMYILPAPVWEESSTERTQRTRRLGERGWREGVVRREAEQRFGPGGELWMLVEPGAAPRPVSEAVTVRHPDEMVDK